MKRKLERLNARLNRVHTVLTNLMCKQTRELSQKEVDAIEKAEELLNDIRNDLAVVANGK